MSTFDPDDPDLPDPFEQLRNDKSFNRTAKKHARATTKARRLGDEPAQQPARAGRGRAVIALVVLAGVGVGAFLLVTGPKKAGPTTAAAASATPSVSPTDGDFTGLPADVADASCYDIDDTTHRYTVRSCSDVHQAQLVGRALVPGTQTTYPTQDKTWGDISAQVCHPKDAAFLGVGVSDGYPVALQDNDLHPSADGWRTGDRTMYCGVAWVPARAGSAKGQAAVGASQSPGAA